MWKRWIPAALLLAVAACVQTNSPWMFPGENCISCHSANGQAFNKVWSVGGTIYGPNADGGVEGAQILIVDARGSAITLTSNGVGNFYTGETLQAPFKKISVGWDGGWVDMPIDDAGMA